MSEKMRIEKLQTTINGWANYHATSTAKSIIRDLDMLVRVRLGMCCWKMKMWKKLTKRVKELSKLGISKETADKGVMAVKATAVSQTSKY